MPRYIYRCELCEETYEVIHGMNEEYEDCDLCVGKGCLMKIPGLVGSFRLLEKTKRPGQIVNKYLKDAKEELKEQKRSLSEKEFK